MVDGPLPWIAFHLLITAAVWLDLRYSREGLRQALYTSLLWVLFALSFAAAIAWSLGSGAATLFITAYLVEKTLSIDNLFVFAALFQAFEIAPEHQRRILLWGVIGAVVMRGLFILGGIALVSRLHLLFYLFVPALLLLAYHFAKTTGGGETPRFLPWLRRYLPIAPETEQGRFFVKSESGNGWLNGWLVTPSFAALLAIELSDVIFAIDSIPAVMSITLDPFLAYTSNICAVLGLRALYFALTALLPLFHYLNYGLALILLFLACKIMISPWFAISDSYSLLFVVSVLILTMTLKKR